MIVAFNETEKSDAYTFIKEFEASESKAYMDTATGQSQMTIGIGSNIQDANNKDARNLAIKAVLGKEKLGTLPSFLWPPRFAWSESYI